MSLESIIPVFEDYSGFYHYKGSLTTPNCFEIVNWIVAKNKVILRPAQVRYLLSQISHATSCTPEILTILILKSLLQMEPLRNLVFYTECEKAMMGDNFRSPDDLPEASIGNRNVEEYVQPPVVTCICEAENGAMWSMHPGFPFNGMLMNMGHVMDMIPEGDGESEVSSPLR